MAAVRSSSAVTAPDALTRVLHWEGCFNVRDAGGLPAAGGQIRRGALIRSDLLTRLTAAGQAALIEHGVRTIIDVRSAEELERDGDRYPFRATTAAEAVTYVNVPFNTGLDKGMADEIRARYHRAQSRAELNRVDLDAHAAGIAAIALAVADARPGGVVIHCHAGKDRTGLVVAVLLALAGVPDEEIADDYALTASSLGPLIVEWLDEMSDDPIERARLTDLAVPRREAMLDALAYLTGRYGSAEGYLRSAGMGAASVDSLCRRLVEVG